MPEYSADQQYLKNAHISNNIIKGSIICKDTGASGVTYIDGGGELTTLSLGGIGESGTNYIEDLLPESPTALFDIGLFLQHHTLHNLTPLDNRPRFFTGICTTAAATAEKVVTCTEYTTLTAGDVIFVNFTNTNTATHSNLTLNVNSTGAKEIRIRYNGNATYDGTIYANALAANQTVMFTYNGTYWILMTPDVYNSTYSTAGLGNAFGVCTTAAATVAKTVSAANYAINQFGYVTVAFQYAVPANATLNINSKGAKSISYFASTTATTPTAIAANVIPAGSIATFVYVSSIGTFTSGTYILVNLSTLSNAIVSNSGTSTTTYYLMGTPSTIGNTLYRYGTSGPYMTGADLFAGSDLMYKKDITSITDDFVEKLFERDDITYDFRWKENDKQSSGFIAQWIEDIMPEMVDGKEGEKHVNYNAALSKTVGALFKKIKQQQKEIDELKELIKNK